MLLRRLAPILYVLAASLPPGAAGAAPAGDAAPPEAYEARSANGQWRARIDPAGEGSPARVRVFRTPAHHEAWTAALREASPRAAYVTDDGRRVIVIDRPAAGVTPGPVRIYTPFGPLQRQSPAGVLGMPGPADAPAPAASLYDAGAAEVLSQLPGEPDLFGLWLPVTRRWLAWDLESGEPVQDDPHALARLNESLRARAIAELAHAQSWDPASAPTYWPLEAIAHQRRPRDRAHLERAVRDDRFLTRPAAIFRHRRPETRFVAESGLRREADRLLAEWDGRVLLLDDEGQPIGTRLGAVRGEVRLPRAPRDRGVIHVVLLPADSWLKDGMPLPAQRVEVRLATDRPAGKSLPFRLGTISPGAYRLAALWIERPLEGSATVFRADRGEWLALGPSIDVRPGRLTDAPVFGAGVGLRSAP